MSTIHNITICGSGLAGALAALALVTRLGSDISVILIETDGSAKTDCIYGTAAPPASYDFFRHLDISEPELLLETNTAFSLGTEFTNWGHNKRSWVQSFHRALPIIEGVGFHHYAARHTPADKDYTLAPYIMSVQAAKAGVFAHPPEGENIPLAAVEYGYHFSHKALTSFVLSRLPKDRVKRIKANIKSVHAEDQTVTALTLTTGEEVAVEFCIDASGQDSSISTALGRKLRSPREIWLQETSQAQSKLGAPLRRLAETETGWQAQTSLQDMMHVLTLSTAKPANDASATLARLGRNETPWRGNCLSFGHCAAALEPLSPAPLMLLHRAIERLVELIPISADMDFEAREYNRRFNEDYVHAQIFHDAMQETESSNAPLHPKLETKLTQFKSRGILVQYDLEPFAAEDWAMLHCGMRRRPERYDPLADRLTNAQVENMLANFKSANKAMALKMPPHDVYMSGLLKYLKGKYAKR